MSSSACGRRDHRQSQTRDRRRETGAPTSSGPPSTPGEAPWPTPFTRPRPAKRLRASAVRTRDREPAGQGARRRPRADLPRDSFGHACSARASLRCRPASRGHDPVHPDAVGAESCRRHRKCAPAGGHAGARIPPRPQAAPLHARAGRAIPLAPSRRLFGERRRARLDAHRAAESGRHGPVHGQAPVRRRGHHDARRTGGPEPGDARIASWTHLSRPHTPGRPRSRSRGMASGGAWRPGCSESLSRRNPGPARWRFGAARRHRLGAGLCALVGARP